MRIETIFRCTHCNEEKQEGGDVDTVFLLTKDGGSYPHMPCKDCRKIIAEHNAPIIAAQDAEEDRKRQARFAKKAVSEAQVKTDEAVRRSEKKANKARKSPESSEPAAVDPLQMLAQSLLQLAEQNAQILTHLQAQADGNKPKPTSSKRRR